MSWAAVDEALLHVVRCTHAHVGAVYLLDDHEQVLRMSVVTGVSSRIAQPWSRVAWAAPVPVAEAARENRMMWLPSHRDIIRRYPRTGTAFPYDVAMCVAPVAMAGTVLGVVLLLWPGTRPSELSADETREIAGAGHAVAAVLTRARAAGSPVEAPERVRTVQPPLPRAEQGRPAATALVERLAEGLCALDLEGRITFLNGAARRLLGPRGADGEDLIGSRPWKALPWLCDPAYENAYLSALFSRLPTSFTALRPPDRWLHFQLFPDATGVSVRVVASDPPKEDRGTPVTPPPPAATGAAALFYLLHLSSAITSAIDVSDVLSAVTDQIMPVINAQGMAMMTWDEGRLNVLCSHGFPPGVDSYFHGSLTSLRSASVLAMETGLPAFYPSNEMLQRRYPHVPLYREMSAFCYLPLVVSGRVFGCCVLGYDRPRPFPPEERAALTSLGGMIAQALARARLYDTTNRVARGLQAALLPQELPRVTGFDVAARYLPATRGMDIGGDFYDLIRVREDTVVAVIGDVQGHNVSAAALMGQIRTTVRTHAVSGAPPDEVLRRTNQLLVDLDSTLFASCLCAEINLPSGKVRVATAGHLPPVLCHADRSTDIAETVPGLLLGIVPDSVYDTSDVTLTPGDLLVLFTDGLVERPDLDLDVAIGLLARQLAGIEGGELSGIDDVPLDALADALMTWGRRTGQGYDDIALLLLRESPAVTHAPC
ncbi:SpoIIE family protein phosphatase [Streptomyces sp. NPDC056161]|uniref:GAF domain-containing SpoIIE family protein phosphatase n=1 Tax=Streptomyces sp. NPDC056161 TaxID=3345732 RepID=UPI0035D53242